MLLVGSVAGKFRFHVHRPILNEKMCTELRSWNFPFRPSAIVPARDQKNEALCQKRAKFFIGTKKGRFKFLD